MLASVRPYATAGVALVGASVMAVSPITVPPAQPEVRSVEASVALAATTSLAYVPINLIHMMINAPGNFIFGMEQFAAAMELSGDWNASHPYNVWGWDDANPMHTWGLVNMFMPIPAISRPVGKHLNWWLTANLPMHEGCTFDCPDLRGMLDKMFKVPMWHFYREEGYTFPEVINPVGGWETDWSRRTVQLDPFEPVKSFWNFLVSKPEAIHIPSMYEVITAFANLASALQTTGHLPNFIAVREIETFFKLFVPKPKNIAPIPPVDPEDPAYDTDSAEPAEPAEQSEARLASTPAGVEDVPEVARTFTLTVDTGAQAPAGDASDTEPVVAPVESADKPAVEPETEKAETAESEDAKDEKAQTADDLKPEPSEKAEESTAKQQTGGRHRRVDDGERSWSRSVDRVESSLSRVTETFKRSGGSSSDSDGSSSTRSSRASSDSAA